MKSKHKNTIKIRDRNIDRQSKLKANIKHEQEKNLSNQELLKARNKTRVQEQNPESQRRSRKIQIENLIRHS